MAMQNIYNYQKPRVMPTQMKSISKQVNSYSKMQNDSKADPYLEQKIMSSKPEELTLMLYEGMVKFIKQGILYNDSMNAEKTNNAIQRAQAIITELNVTLKDEYEISRNLSDIYSYMKGRLIDANLEKNSEILEEVLGFAEELRDTWKEAMQLAR